jgi:uncharacterized protein YndB with AHSA1/START domain
MTNDIKFEHRYDQPKDAVWAALTTPELLARWWAPGNIAPIAGHRFTMDMGSWGQQQCEVRTVEPGAAISFLFSEGMLDTTITWQLEEVADGTVLQFEHAGFNLDTPMGRTAYEGMGSGWPGLLNRLDGILAGLPDGSQ